MKFEHWPRPNLSSLPPPRRPPRPFDVLPALSAGQREAIEREAGRVNERYLTEFIEAYGFCPYAKKGRQLGQIRRYMHFANQDTVSQLVTLMHAIAADASQVVVQVVLPLVEVEPEDWQRFVGELTEHGNAALARDDRMGTAALHPGLNYSDINPFSMLTLFRRAPDPTIQWVRLDAVRALYEGRGGGTRAVSLEDIDALLSRPVMTPLYDRIAITNARMARRLKLDHVERLLADYADDGRRAYHQILLDPRLDGPPEDGRGAEVTR